METNAAGEVRRNAANSAPRRGTLAYWGIDRLSLSAQTAAPGVPRATPCRHWSYQKKTLRSWGEERKDISFQVKMTSTKKLSSIHIWSSPTSMQREEPWENCKLSWKAHLKFYLLHLVYPAAFLSNKKNLMKYMKFKNFRATKIVKNYQIMFFDSCTVVRRVVRCF